MNAANNKQLIQKILTELSAGNYGSFFDAMSNEISWTWMGTKDLSKTFAGKKAVTDELWASVKTSMVQPYKINMHRLIAEGDFVVVEAQGENTTTDGKLYHNKYCWVCQLANGKILRVREYMDTQLVAQTFGVQ